MKRRVLLVALVIQLFGSGQFNSNYDKLLCADHMAVLTEMYRKITSLVMVLGVGLERVTRVMSCHPTSPRWAQ